MGVGLCHRHQSHMIVTTNIISITLSIFIKGNTCYDNDKSPLTLARSYCYVIAFPCAITLHLKSCLSSHPSWSLFTSFLFPYFLLPRILSQSNPKDSGPAGQILTSGSWNVTRRAALLSTELLRILAAAHLVWVEETGRLSRVSALSKHRKRSRTCDTN